MKRTDKIRLIILICVVFVLLAAGILLITVLKQPDTGKEVAAETISFENSSVPETVTDVDARKESAESSPETKETERKEMTKEQVSESSTKGNHKDGNGSSQSTSPVLPSQSTEPEVIVPIIPPSPEPEVTNLSFPYAIPGTSLVIRQVSSYDGIYLEDGSDTEISGVSAMILENTGSSAVEFVRIQLEGDTVTYAFEASALPAQSVVVIQEKNKASYQDLTYHNCIADVAPLEQMDMSAGKILLVDNGNNTLSITNLTDSEIPCVRVFYKFFMGDDMVYVGGITYNAKVTDLKPGETKKITPGHYISGSSNVMMIRTYETAD